MGIPALDLTYNAANRLSAVSERHIVLAAFTYEAFGQRVAKVDPGDSRRLYVYDWTGNLLEETGGRRSPIDYVYLDGKPIAEILPVTGKVYYLYDDRLGSPQVATNRHQNVVWSATCQPFGKTGRVTGSLTQNLRLPGQYS
jgi:YD repeat-containing protein